MLQFNDIIREEAERYGVLVMDFQHDRSSKTPACSPKTGCTATNSATSAWRPPWPGGSAIDGADESWAEPFPEAAPRLRTREQLAADVEWARRYFAPWIGRGIRRIPHGSGLNAKRPVLTPVPKQWS
jgi:hypothetical protein